MSLPCLLVTFRSQCGVVLDRVKVRASTDAEAISLARSMVISRATMNRSGAPDTSNPTVSAVVEKVS